MKLLLICHGRKHNRPAWLNLSSQIWQNAVYLDKDVKSEPDICEDITKVSFDSGSFDAIICIHCPTNLIVNRQGRLNRATWSKFEKWLRPGGIFVASLPIIGYCIAS